MTTQHDDMAGPGAADRAPGQAVPAGQAADADQVVLDDPVPGNEREPAEDREPADAGPVVAEREPADAGPVVAEHEPADAGPVVAEREPTADAPDTIPAFALAEQQWPAIQALFVDDPRGAVERAAAAAGEVAASLVTTLQREQAELRASWQQDADTERLRTTLQRYRAFCGRLAGLA